MKKQDLGSCPYCGEQLFENKNGWGCSNFKGGCRAFIFKNDKFFSNLLGRSIKKNEALKLIMGDTLHFKGVVYKGKDREFDLSWGQKEDSKYPFGFTIDFKDDKRKETLYD